MSRHAIAKHFLFIGCVLILACGKGKIDDQFGRIEHLVTHGKNTEALDAYHGLGRELKEAPRTPLVWFRYGTIAEQMGEVDEALAAYARVLMLTPFSELSRITRENRAQLFEKKHDIESLLEEYTNLITSFPQPPAVWRYRLRLAEGFLMEKQWRQARLELSQLNLEPELPDELRETVLFDIGESFFLEGNAKEALQAYGVFYKKYPHSHLVGEVIFKSAQCMESLGFLGSAERLAKEAQKTYDNTKVVEQYLHDLHEDATYQAHHK